MSDVNDTRAIGPVTSGDLEDMVTRISQAVSTLAMLTNCHEANGAPSLQNALGLLMGHLGDCAKDLSELHLRQQEMLPPSTPTHEPSLPRP